MPTPAEIIDMVASLQNDTAQAVYTDAAVLPYFNMALRDLQEEFELNDIPVTYETSALINIPAGTVVLTFGGSPAIPTDLIEIKKLWESVEGQNNWIPMVRKDFLPHQLEVSDVSSFLVWAWIDNEIHLPESNQDNDLKIDYIKSLFGTILIAAINTELGAKYKNIFSYLGYRTAALCSMFIGENETRAQALQDEAAEAINKSMGISIKGKQAIFTRRKPFRYGYKTRGRYL
jgi:hypothetical protein